MAFTLPTPTVQQLSNHAPFTPSVHPSRSRLCSQQRIEALQGGFSLIMVKVLLVSLLNGFRDLTLMGVQAFDFNHLDNVLVSRDCRRHLAPFT